MGKQRAVVCVLVNRNCFDLNAAKKNFAYTVVSQHSQESSLVSIMLKTLEQERLITKKHVGREGFVRSVALPRLRVRLFASVAWI
jgi:hypothetical protein